METIRLVQLQKNGDRHVALVREPVLLLLTTYTSVYELALAAIRSGIPLQQLIPQHLSEISLDYDPVYQGCSDWKLLPSFDHPFEQQACLVAGTGLTHKKSALNRQMMHGDVAAKPTDSMVMYQWGVENGSPAEGEIGVQPEWFYKGCGSVLRAHGEPLEVPPFANDGGEEPEVAGVYLVNDEGIPVRIGLTTGNEFSDHVMEKKNYLYLAPSKLRTCSIGPELLIGGGFDAFSGEVSVSRGGKLLWSSPINSGEQHMAHTLGNLEYHHFKYPGHRIPLQAHVHFFGADAFSFGSGIALQNGDEMKVDWQQMGRPLLNKVQVSEDEEELIKIGSI